MSVLDNTTDFPSRLLDIDAEEVATIDLRGEVIELRDHRPDGSEAHVLPDATAPTALPDGFRLQGVRVVSMAKIAAVLFGVGHLALLGTLVVCWNVLQQLGFVTDVEDMAITSLGLESFAIDGQQLFELAAIVTGVVFLLGFVITVLLTLVYNAACALLGGVALEVRPLRRPTRVFSPRHRRFVSIV